MGRNEKGAECCMCGDHGLSSELFTCKNCEFRSQHKYCSNLYPGAESYNNCNWCLTLKDDKKGGGEELSKSSSHKTTSSDLHHQIKIKNKSKREIDCRRHHHPTQIKKQIKFPADRAAPLASAGRKRVTSDHGQGIIKRSRSEEISNNGGIIKKPVLRSKMRRYKLLDEVSC